MVLIIEHRDDFPLPPVRESAARSTEIALRHMHWHFVADDASALLRRRPFPLVSPRTAQEAP